MARSPAHNSIDYASKRFLVIDDIPHARMALRTIIANLEAKSIDFCGTHAEAIYKIRNGAPYDIILCDYILGDGRDGQQLLEELRFNRLIGYRTLFMMVTAEHGYEQVVSAVELAPDDYILKPFTPDRLHLRLDRLVAKKEALKKVHIAVDALRYDDALKVCQQMVDLDPEGPYVIDLLRLMADIHLLIGEPEKARAHYEAVLTRYEVPWAKVGLSRSHMAQKNIAAAETILDQVLAESPNYFGAFDLKAQVLEEKGDTAGAEAMLDNIAKRTPRNYRRKRSLGQLSLANGNVAKAASLFEEVMSSDTTPGNKRTDDFLNMARALIGQGQFDDAVRTIEGLSRSLGGELEAPPLTRAMLALAQLRRGNRDAAERAYGELAPLIEKNQVPFAAMADVATVAFELDHESAGCELIRQMISCHSGTPTAFKQIKASMTSRGLGKQFADIQANVAMGRVRMNQEINRLREAGDHAGLADMLLAAAELPDASLHLMAQAVDYLAHSTAPDAGARGWALLNRARSLDADHSDVLRMQSRLQRLAR